jgi:hypothetical protein
VLMLTEQVERLKDQLARRGVSGPLCVWVWACGCVCSF